MGHNTALANSKSPGAAVLCLGETNMHSSYTQLMYGKYTLFYKSLKNWGYYAHAHTVCTRPLLKGEGPGDEAKKRYEHILIYIYICCLGDVY